MQGQVAPAARLRRALGMILAEEDDPWALGEHNPERAEEHADMLRRAIMVLQWAHHEQTGEFVPTDPPAMLRDWGAWLERNKDVVLAKLLAETDPEQRRRNLEQTEEVIAFLEKVMEAQRAYNAEQDAQS